MSRSRRETPAAPRRDPAPAGPDAVDARQLVAAGLPEGPFPGGRRADFRAFVDPAVHDAIWRHASEDTTVEVCGVLVGEWRRDAAGPFVAAVGSIRGTAATSKFAEVTFTHETWAKINAELDRDHAGRSIVGWYHTHPDFGVFLSDRDIFIHENFFSGPGQVALVVDPVRRTEGVFAWRGGRPELLPFVWVGDELRHSTAAGAESRPETIRMSPAPEAAAPPAARAADWLDALTRVLAWLCLFLLGTLLGGWFARLSDDTQQIMLMEAATARYGFVGVNARDRLGRDLDAVRADTLDLARDIEALADALPPAKGRAAADREAFLRRARTRTQATLDQLDLTKRQYAFTDDETAIFERLLAERIDAEFAARIAALQPKAEPKAPAAPQSKPKPKPAASKPADPASPTKPKAQPAPAPKTDR